MKKLRPVIMIDEKRSPVAKDVHGMYITKPKEFKTVIRFISDLITEGTFNYSAEGVTLTHMDPANVAMIIVEIKKIFFSKFSMTGKDSLNMTNLKVVLKDVQPTDALSIVRNNSTKKYQISIHTPASDKKFEVSTIDLGEKEQKVPTLKHSASVTMDTKTLSQMVIDAGKSAESITFSVSQKGFGIKAEGDVSSYNELLVPSESVIIDQTEKDKTVTAKFSVEYLKKLIYQPSMIFPRVTLRLATDYPIQVEYANESMKIKGILAPRVEND